MVDFCRPSHIYTYIYTHTYIAIAILLSIISDHGYTAGKITIISNQPKTSDVNMHFARLYIQVQLTCITTKKLKGTLYSPVGPS